MVSRAELIAKNPTRDMQISALLNLSAENRQHIWLSKLSQLQSQNLPEIIAEKVDRAITLIKNDGLVMTEDLSEAIAYLEGNIPNDHLLHMFSIVNDYDYEGDFNRELDTKAFFSSSLTTKGDCSCRWCIGAIDGTHGDCDETGSGCGFLWIQSCNRRPIW
jgi:hypothetical protein